MIEIAFSSFIRFRCAFNPYVCLPLALSLSLPLSLPLFPLSCSYYCSHNDDVESFSLKQIQRKNLVAQQNLKAYENTPSPLLQRTGQLHRGEHYIMQFRVCFFSIFGFIFGCEHVCTPLCIVF